MTRAFRGLRLWLGSLSTPRLLFLGYGVYMLAGWALLSLPFAHSEPVRLIDSLFIAVSAVSTTGLASVDPGGSFNLFGEVVILALIQAGGLGYMTLGSIAALALKRKLSLAQQHAAIGAFGLPADFDLRLFLREIGGFVLCVEAVGAVLLWILFARAGVENALWAGIFHSVSAFCTAGFSLFANSLEDFRSDGAVNLTVAALSYLGAIGFLVFADVWENVRGRRRALGFVSRVILVTTLAFSVFGALLFYVFEPSITALPGDERALAAFFQAMTATTTVGFNTVPHGTAGGGVGDGDVSADDVRGLARRHRRRPEVHNACDAGRPGSRHASGPDPGHGAGTRCAAGSHPAGGRVHLVLRAGPVRGCVRSGVGGGCPA